MLFRILFFIFGGWCKYRKVKRDWTVVVCTSCGSEQKTGTRFCRRCGGDELVSIGEANRLRQDHRREEIKQLNARCRRNQAINRIRQVFRFHFCDQCNTYFEDHPQFCTQCGARVIGAMPPAYVFQIVQREYHDLIPDEDAFETLRYEQPEAGVESQSLKLGLTQAVDQLTHNAAWTKKQQLTFWGILAAIAVIVIIVSNYQPQHPQKKHNHDDGEGGTTRDQLDNEAAEEARQKEPQAMALTTPNAAMSSLTQFTPVPTLGESLPALESAPLAKPSPESNPALTVEEWKKKAIEQFPQLAVSGSPLNAEFVAKYRAYQGGNYFDSPDWPMRLAKECAAALPGTTQVIHQ